MFHFLLQNHLYYYKLITNVKKMKHQEFSQGKWPYASEIPFSSESQDLGNSELFVCFHVTLERKSF